MNGLLDLLRVQWDRAIAVTAGVLGALALLLGYIGVSGTPFVAKQLPYFVSGGLFGIFLLGIAATAWLSSDMRDEWRELVRMRELLEAKQDAVPHVTETDVSKVPATPTKRRLAAAGSTRKS